VKSDIRPGQITPYNFYRDLWPDSINPHLKDCFYLLNDSLHSEQPDFISDLAIYSPRPWQFRPSFLDIYVFGGFRSRYKALARTAEMLAEFYLQNGFLPLVQPLTKKDWRLQIGIDGRIYRSLQTAGILLYSTSEWL